MRKKRLFIIRNGGLDEILGHCARKKTESQFLFIPDYDSHFLVEQIVRESIQLKDNKLTNALKIQNCHTRDCQKITLASQSVLFHVTATLRILLALYIFKKIN